MWIIEAGRERAFTLPAGSAVTLPMPTAAYDANALRSALAAHGEPEAIDEGEVAARVADLLGARQGTVRMSSFDAAASRLLEGLSGTSDGVMTALRIPRAADLMPTTHSLVVVRTATNPTGFSLLQVALTAPHALAGGRAEVKH